MKKILFAFICFCITASAQTTPEAFINAVPNYSSMCSKSEDEVSKFADEVSLLKDKIEKLIEQKNSELGGNEEENDEMQSDAYSQLGLNLSPEDIKKLEDENLSEEERAKLQEKLMKQVMENAMNMQKGNQEDIKKKFHESEIINELVNDAMSGKYFQIKNEFVKIEADASAFYKKFITPLEKERAEKYGDGEQSSNKPSKDDALMEKIIAQKKIYCSKFIPRYEAALAEMLTYIKNALPKIRTAEQSAMKSIQKDNMDIMSLEYVSDYISQVAGIVSYHSRAQY